MRASLPLWPLLALALPAAATASPSDDVRHVSAPVTTTLVYDDGETDSLVQPVAGHAIEFAMGFSAPTEPNRLAAVTVCLGRTFSGRPTGNLSIRVYEDDGGAPGALLGSAERAVTNVGLVLEGSFHDFDLTDLAIDLPDRDFFVGVELDRNDNDLHLCQDHDGVAGFRPLYLTTESGAWADFRDHGGGGVRAFMIRATVQSSEPCDAGAGAVFLLGGRFRVDACWRTRDGASGVGRLAVQQGTGATLWFFNPDNPELFVKVRDACVDPFQRFWLFVAGLTDVEVALTVTDTHAGVTRTYFNPLGRAFEPVQDTGGFATCP